MMNVGTIWYAFIMQREPVKEKLQNGADDAKKCRKTKLKERNT
jgi:hypothetical protein